MKYFLAVDIYPFYGRHVIGWIEKGKLKTEEVYRFLNNPVNFEGHKVWDIEYIFEKVCKGLEECAKKYPKIETMAIDAFGTDYVIMREDEEVLPVYSYLDEMPMQTIEELHSLIPFKQIYERTGVGFRNFNSIYRLYSDKKEERLDGATDFLMIPEYIAYRLTGNKKKELTGAATTSMINVSTLRFDRKIWSIMGLPITLDMGFSPFGTSVGRFKPEIAKNIGLDTEVILTATNAAANAIESIDVAERKPYVLLGGRILIGAKTSNAIVDDKSRELGYSNSRGVEYNRYQKSIMGMALIDDLVRELCPNADSLKTTELARASNFEEIFDIMDESFTKEGVRAAIDAYLFGHGKPYPKTIEDYFKAAYNSIAFYISEAVEEIEHSSFDLFYEIYLSGTKTESEYIAELLRRHSRKNVIILPPCDSAVGNIKLQMIANKLKR